MQKYTAISLLSLLVVTQVTKPQQGHKNVSLVAASALIIGAVKTYSWFRTPLAVETDLAKLNLLTFNPYNSPAVPATQTTLHQVCTNIQQGMLACNEGTVLQIGEKNYALSCQLPANVTGDLTLYVPGYAGTSGNARYKGGGAGAHATAKYIRNGIMPEGPCISFDGQGNTRRTFNCGQEDDQYVFKNVLTSIIKRNPDANITIAASCIGGTAVLNCLSNPENQSIAVPVKNLVLESPSTCIESLTQNIAQNHLPHTLQPVLPKLFACNFPNCKEGLPTIIDSAKNFPPHISVLMGRIMHDKVASPHDVENAYNALHKENKKVALFTCSDLSIKHGHLTQDPAFQAKVQQLYRQNRALSK